MKSLKGVLKLYKQSLTVEDEPLSAPSPANLQKDIKAETEAKISEYSKISIAKLGYFFAIACALSEKDRINPNPLSDISIARQETISEMYRIITSLPHEKETSLSEEAERASQIFSQLLNNSDDAIGQIMRDKELISTKFIVNNRKENEYGTTQPISIIQKTHKEEPHIPEPVHEEVPIQKEEPVIEAAKPIKEESAPEPPKEEFKQNSWADNVDDEDEDENENEPEPEKEEPEKEKEENDEIFVGEKKNEEEEFETFYSKADARKKEEEENRKGHRGRRGGYGERRPRGRGYRGGRQGGYRKDNESGMEYGGEHRGNYRGGRRGHYNRGGRRGEYRGPRRAEEADVEHKEQ